MPTDNTLYLVAEEIELFQKLPADMTKKWKPALKTETIDAYEDAETIKKNIQQSRFEMPGMQEFMRKSAVGDKTAKVPDPTKISEESWAEYFATIGASGASALIQIWLQSDEMSAEQLDGVAAVSRIRHEILKSNLEKKKR